MALPLLKTFSETTMAALRLRRFAGWEWRQLFVESLLLLWPAMNPDAADEISDSQFALSSGIPARQAAEEYLLCGATVRNGS
jgi:hypothetical protein